MTITQVVNALANPSRRCDVNASRTKRDHMHHRNDLPWHDAPTPESAAPDAAKIRQFFGSVEIDMVRPIKALETIIEAIVMQLQHSPGAKVKLTLDIEATSPDGFSESDISVIRDNARQLKFKPESTGFEE